jgi:hypothetical protein
VYTTRDLTNILQLMQTSRPSGDLTVEPLEQDGIPWQGYFRLVDGQITTCQIRNKTNAQVVLRGEEALRWAINARHGKLTWSLEEDVQSSDLSLPLLPPTRDNVTGEERQDKNRQDTDTYRSARNTSGSLSPITPPPQNNNNPPSSPPPPTAWRELPGSGTIPKRTKPGMFTPGNTLTTRDHRQVFSLIDGHKSIEEIAHLLHKPSGFIARMIMDLKTMNLVE